MSDPVFVPFRCKAWVAHIDPPLFLSSINELMPEGGRNV